MTEIVSARQIVEVIQKIKDLRCSQVKFLISLADNAYKYINLTPKQEECFYKCVKELKEQGKIDAI